MDTANSAPGLDDPSPVVRWLRSPGLGDKRDGAGGGHSVTGLDICQIFLTNKELAATLLTRFQIKRTPFSGNCKEFNLNGLHLHHWLIRKKSFHSRHEGVKLTFKSIPFTATSIHGGMKSSGGESNSFALCNRLIWPTRSQHPFRSD